MLDPVIRDFARDKNFGSISFHLPDGAIGTHVMWVDADDEHVLINTEVHRLKYKAVTSDPNVTVTIWGSDPYQYAEVRGKVHLCRLQRHHPERARHTADHPGAHPHKSLVSGSEHQLMLTPNALPTR
jgi:hypothetical protein